MIGLCTPTAARDYLNRMPVIDLFVALDVFRQGHVRIGSCEPVNLQTMLEKFLRGEPLDVSNVVKLANGVRLALHSEGRA